MCFYNDNYDWIANLWLVMGSRAEADCRCYECRRAIRAGEWRTHVYQQEYEECRICEDDPDDSGLYDPGQDPATCQHDYGETFSCDICRECSLILAAIYDLEERERCPEYARQPMYGELRDELWEDRRHGSGEYSRHALELYPELSNHELLAR